VPGTFRQYTDAPGLLPGVIVIPPLCCTIAPFEAISAQADSPPAGPAAPAAPAVPGAPAGPVAPWSALRTLVLICEVLVMMILLAA
jgi:hypothetical protein